MGKELQHAWEKTVSSGAGRTAVQGSPQGSGCTFGELDERAKTALAGAGLGSFRNRVVAFQLQNSPDWLARFLACQFAGAIAMPVDPDVPAAGLQRICEQSGAAALWTREGLQPLEGGKRRAPACLVKLTSGSTGLPRPLFFEDRQMLADGRNIISTMGIRAEDINLASIPFGHSYGLGNLVMPLILQGTAVAIAPDPFPFALAERALETGATVFPAVPALLNALVRAEVPSEALSSLRLCISAGSPLSGPEARAFHEKFGRKLHNFYGSSETGGIAYDRSGEETLAGRSVGTPLDHVETGVSASGRLMVTSKAVFHRHNRLAQGGRGRWLLPDLAVRHPDGRISLLGRRSRMVKIAGKRLNPAEVEQALLETADVSGAFVAEVRENGGRLRLAAVVATGREVRELAAALRERLPSWKIPTRWIRVEALPLTARGKPDYRTLAAWVQAS